MVPWVSIVVGTDIDVALMNVSWALKSLENIEWHNPLRKPFQKLLEILLNLQTILYHNIQEL